MGDFYPHLFTLIRSPGDWIKHLYTLVTDRLSAITFLKLIKVHYDETVGKKQPDINSLGSLARAATFPPMAVPSPIRDVICQKDTTGTVMGTGDQSTTYVLF
jgi:hypothetical protein